jgi:hypothetical protein
MPRKSMKHKTQNKRTRNKVQHRPRDGLAGDGKTFSLEMAVPRARNFVESQVQRFTQNFSIQSFFTTSTSNPTFTQITAAFNQIDQYAALASIYDQYRIDAVEAWLVPQVSADVSTRQGQLFTVLDFDDASALITILQAQDYDTCVTTPQSSGQYRHFKPHVALAAFAPSAFTSFSNVVSPWIDTSSPTVSHYGVKIAASTSNTTSQTFDLNLRLLISLKNVR